MSYKNKQSLLLETSCAKASVYNVTIYLKKSDCSTEPAGGVTDLSADTTVMLTGGKSSGTANWSESHDTWQKQ